MAGNAFVSVRCCLVVRDLLWIWIEGRGERGSFESESNPSLQSRRVAMVLVPIENEYDGNDIVDDGGGDDLNRLLTVAVRCIVEPHHEGGIEKVLGLARPCGSEHKGLAGEEGACTA